MKFAKRLESIKPSATLAISAKAQELKAQGIPVISLALGEPDFATPEHICKAAKKAINEGKTRYTAVNGIIEAKKAVCNYFSRSYGEVIEPKNVIITNGGKQSLYNLFMILCQENDEVIVPSPYWTSYPEMVELSGAKAVIAPTSAENAFKVSIEDLEKAYSPKTKVLLLNSPSNPTGARYSQEELDALALWAIEKDLFIISDEIYDQLIYNNGTKASLVHLFSKYPDKIAICNGMAKAFAMTGWRLGYTVAHPEVIKHCTTIQSQATSNVCTIAQYALVEALNADYDCIEEMRQAFERRLELAYEEISSWEGVLCPKPEGAFYLFPDFKEVLAKKNMTGDELCTLILEKANVALVPGSAFGNPTCLRFSYALADDELIKALKAVREVIYS